MDTKLTPEDSSAKVASLLDVIPLSKNKKNLILPHDNPDPDSIASAAALRALIKHKLAKPSIIGLSGIVGRSENRAMVSTLDIVAEVADFLLRLDTARRKKLTKL